MFFTEEISLRKAENLLNKCDLTLPEGVDYTAGVYDDQGSLVATASLKDDMIQAVAVDPARQGEDLMGVLMTHIIGEAGRRGMDSLHLFTKPEKAVQFQGLGFRLVASARPYAALLEWGRGGIEDFKRQLRKTKCEVSQNEDVPAGAIVMNCNPFTKGHRYLIEKAAGENQWLYVIVVEEDKSEFAFKDRLAMVKSGTSDLKNVTVLSGGRYAVSSLTFPSYFTKEENLAKAQTAMDAELFARCIAPELGIKVRYVGTEPLSPVTAIYNQTLKERLPKAGIQVEEICRLESEGDVISASRVRVLLEELRGTKEDDRRAEILEKLEKLLPKTSLKYIMEAGYGN